MRTRCWMRRCGAFAAAMVLLGCAAMTAAPPPIPDAETTGLAALGWLSGSWVRKQGGSVSEEHWIAPVAGTMFGINRSIRDGVTVFYEYLRIVEHDGAIAFHAAPRGGAETAFKLVDSGPGRARFENPAHDFPQSITYSREGDTLSATIGGVVDGQQRNSSWQWQRQ